jgi:peptide/nickel transport system substrate-binding protein
MKVKRGGTLVTATTSFPPAADPLFDTLGQTLKEMALYESLLRYAVVDFKQGKLELKPELAESWQQPDPKTVILKLRKGVKFHDGSDLDAEVVKWSLQRMGSHPKSLSKRLADNFASLEVNDPQTLKITYKATSALNLLNLTPATGGTGSVGPVIVSKAQWDKLGEEEFRVKPSATGPMKLVDWKRDQEFVLTKFDQYWRDGVDGRKLPYLDGIRYRLIPDTAVLLVELRAGTLHMTRGLALSDIPAVKANSDLEMITIGWAPVRWYYGINQKKDPVGANQKLRQAVQYSTDRENLAKVLAPDGGSADYLLGWIPAWSGYDDKMSRYDYNADKAANLVKDAGFSNGVTLTLNHYTPTLYRRLAEMLQAMWGKANIKVTLEPGDQAAVREKVKLGEFGVHIWNMAPSPDPALFNRMFTCEGAANWSNYCNKEADKCMFDGEIEIDAVKRADIYKRCQRIFYEDALQGGLLQTYPILVYRKEVKGIGMQAFSEDVQEVWLDT